MRKAAYSLAVGCKAKVIVEIGVWKGELSQKLLKVPSLKELHLIDPWKQYPGCGNLIALNNFTQVYRWAQGRDNVFVHRMTSEHAASTLDIVADFVFIDGDHAEEAVAIDIECWGPRVARGGILAGDNYEMVGVYNAVNKMLPKHTVLLEEQVSQVWVVRKDKGEL